MSEGQLVAFAIVIGIEVILFAGLFTVDTKLDELLRRKK